MKRLLLAVVAGLVLTAGATASGVPTTKVKGHVYYGVVGGAPARYVSIELWSVRDGKVLVVRTKPDGRIKVRLHSGVWSARALGAACGGMACDLQPGWLGIGESGPQEFDLVLVPWVGYG